MKRFNLSLVSAAVLSSLVSPFSFAEDDDDIKNQNYIEKIRILGASDKLRTQGGAATLIGELELEKFEFDDINRVLANVPGVNIREEDGYGLRPNIGFRGATAERSKKINIMEDGILIGPAPYSAPAAYYFPLMSKMTVVEVFKGASAIKYGPNTVSGALNFVTRQIPEQTEIGFDLAAGTDGYGKAHGFYGDQIKDFGFLVEGIALKSDGFKTLDNGGDTGFDKNEWMAKAHYDLSGGKMDHLIEVKLSYSDEVSDETYLGLSDADFKANPNRRYAASQLDKMDWEHTTLQFTHFIDEGQWNLTTRAYRHDFERSWNKVKGFDGNTAPSLATVLVEPDNAGNADFYAILTGTNDGKIWLGDNAREYYSQGIQSDLTIKTNFADLDHKFDIGVRFHQDQIERNHTEDLYLMTAGNLQSAGATTILGDTNREQTDAVSIYLQDTVTIDALTVTAGIRGELINSEYQNRLIGQEGDWLKKESQILLPSVSAFYKLDDNYGIFAGVHQGYIPSGPQQDDEQVDAEKSVNYELGARFADNGTSAEIVWFMLDYSNIKEACSFSTASQGACTLDQEFNGGDVDVMGIEASLSSSFELTQDIELPVTATYTFTDAEFNNSFESTYPLWGNVEVGDPLPYMAEQQFTLQYGLSANNWQVSIQSKYRSEMQEASGDNVELSGYELEALWVHDLSANYSLNDQHSLYVKVDNLTDEQKIVSRRPDGARPSKPQQAILGYKYRF